jgi:hypothetical protein
MACKVDTDHCHDKLGYSLCVDCYGTWGLDCLMCGQFAQLGELDSMQRCGECKDIPFDNPERDIPIPGVTL